MGDTFIADLFLEKLDKAYQESKITIGSLVDGGITPELITEASERGLIKNPDRPNELLTGNENKDTVIELTITGFEYLNQIRIKKAIEKFNESSDRAYNQLNASIIKFNESSDKYSKLIIFLTAVLIAFTILLVFFTPTSNTILEKTVIMVLVVGITYFGIKWIFKHQPFLLKGQGGFDMSNGKEIWDKLWELSIAMIGIYFALYTTAKDYLADKVQTTNALILTGPFFFVLMIGLILGLYFGTKLILKRETKK